MKEIEFRLVLTIRAVAPSGTTPLEVVETVQGLLEYAESISAAAFDEFVASLADELSAEIEDTSFGTIRTEVEVA